ASWSTIRKHRLFIKTLSRLISNLVPLSY
ncbi:transcriptional regulatory, C domain protein, partial [Vibrio parahaemolyticus VPTS-2010_2]